MRRTSPMLLLALVATVAHGAAPTEVSFKRDVLPIFETRCASCHMVGDSQGSLVLEREYAYAMIVDAPAVEAPLKRVEPGSPERSYLYQKLTFGYRQVGGTGWNMPIGFMPLSASELDIVRRWITAGARNN